MLNPPKYIYLIDFLLKKRKKVDGLNSDIIFSFNEIDQEQISNIEDLENMLGNFKRDEVVIDGAKNTIIDSFEIDNNDIKILNSSTKKLEKYRDEIINDKITINAELKPIKLPADITWDNIEIKFLDGHDVKVKISNNDYNNKFKTNFAAMGFKDYRKGLPNKQWDFLKLLAKMNGRIDWGDANAQDSFKKTKSLCAKALKVYFQITDDPFYPYHQNNCYEARFGLVPEKPDENIENDDSLGIREEYEAKATSEYDSSEMKTNYLG